MKRFSRETYPTERLSKNAKFQSYIKQLANIIRVYEKREGLGDPYDDYDSVRPEATLASTAYSLGQAQNNEGKAGIAPWPNAENDILSGAIHEFGINDKSQFRRIMRYFGNLAASNQETIYQLIYSELQKNL